MHEHIGQHERADPLALVVVLMRRTNMSSRDFRRMALALPDTIEGAHMGHPDFRVNGRIFATLHADMKFGMVNLTPEQQQDFIGRNAAFAPESGAWGLQGCTRVRLDAIDEETLGEALTLARQHVVEKLTARKSRPRSTRNPLGRRHRQP